ncbi:hypothetical protein OCAR_5664 [Afipia carboxidovorans OM5]|nr:hypothetical protein OCAR_5664 [Afipia carboxidovorans OM5]
MVHRLLLACRSSPAANSRMSRQFTRLASRDRRRECPASRPSR